MTSNPNREDIKAKVAARRQQERDRAATRSQEKQKRGAGAGRKKAMQEKKENPAEPEGIACSQDRPDFVSAIGGIYYQHYDKKGKPAETEWLCSPIKILAQTRSVEQSNWGLLLEWSDPDGHKHAWSAPKRMLIGDGLLFFRELADRGLRIAPGKRPMVKLTEFFQSSEVDRRVTCTEKTGWHIGGVYVLPDRTIGGTDENEVIFQSEDNPGNPYETAGTAAEWREKVSFLCRGNSRLVFAVSAAFAAPLLEITGVENGGIHYVGASSTGKTTAGIIAGSVFGGAGMRLTWNATTNGLGAMATLFNDAVMILDELSQCDPRAAGETAYLLSNGVEKGRANRNGGMRSRRRWRLLWISNGEIDLEQHLLSDGRRVKAGQGVRLLSIPADAGAGLGLFENIHGYESGAAFADATKAAALKSFGTAGPAFIEEISRRRDEVLGRVASMRIAFDADNVPSDAESQSIRAAGRFALIGAAGELATEFGITGWEPGEAMDAAAVCFRGWCEARGGVGNYEEQAFLSHVRQHFERYGMSRYAPFKDDGRIINDRAGFREFSATDMEGIPGACTYYVLPEVFNSELCKEINPRQAREILRRRGILWSNDAEGKDQMKKRLPGFSSSQRCFCILGERLFRG